MFSFILYCYLIFASRQCNISFINIIFANDFILTYAAIGYI